MPAHRARLPKRRPYDIQGVVGSLNRYLGIDHISTGGYNARANAIVERFMQTLNAMLR